MIVALPGLFSYFFFYLTVLRRWSRSYSLLLCGLFCESVCFVSYLVLFVLVFFSPFSIVITLLGEERANLSAFRAFVRFALICFCLFPVQSFWCLGRAAVCDCCIPWTFLLPFFYYSTKKFVLNIPFCYFVLVFFCPFSIEITLLGEDRANHSHFRTFVRLALV